MNKVLSIIIPTYNMEALLDQCLTSLVLPDKRYREMMDVIVVIDGATDRSSEIAHRYADKYPEMFSVIDKENGNYGSCINAALPHVKGKYVRILDADDSYNSDNLSEYITVLETQNVDLILSDYDTTDELGRITGTHKVNAVANVPITLYNVYYTDFIPMHTVAYRSSIFKEIDYHQTEGVSYTDLEWVFQPMSCVKKVFYYDKTIYRYLIGREGQTVDASVRLKRLGHMERGLWSQLKVYKSIPKSNESYEYLSNVIKYRTKLIYIWGMDKNSDYNLSAFDKKLKKEYPAIYALASRFTLPLGVGKIQMPIVKMWRRVRNKKALYLYPYYDLYCLLNRIRK